eukprot:GHUV01049040.1.p1 GENE.GHUV01049040.1~~GHUV01049040.1.p1  ORF type:complete len:191 (-),score=40.93 GHUV01049040.1:173-745(-)
MAHLQHTVYEEYLPVLLGALLPPYMGYNESVNPSVDNFFCTVALRYGHSVVTDTVMRLDDNGNEHPQGHLLLEQSWYQPDKVLAAGVEPIIRGLVSSSQGAVEPRFSSAIQHNLFGPSNMNGSDLFAINIQRGRDHGLPDYNTCRCVLLSVAQYIGIELTKVCRCKAVPSANANALPCWAPSAFPCGSLR